VGGLVLLLVVLWLAIVAGFRSYFIYRRTGEVRTPPSARRGSAQWWARVISTIAILLAYLAPIADLLEWLEPIRVLDRDGVRWLGFGLYVLGIIGTLYAQSAMGDSWQPDIDPDRQTALVTTGPFAVVRNPVLACTEVTAAGLALLLPNVLGLLMLAMVLIGHQMQVRLVEEPYLARVHGEAYRRYAARTGRFVPFLGRLSPGGAPPR
jgi:protein-S-isoprenylcysteine O-methyltransferase Ste14